MLGTAVAQDNALTLVKATPANGETVTRVDYIMLEFSKEVIVALPEGGIAVTNENTKEVYNLTSYNPNAPKHIVALSFEQKENDKGDVESNCPKSAGTYTYTIPAGCITTADGEEFTETFTFKIDNPLALVNRAPGDKPVSQVSNIALQFSKDVTMTLPEEPIIIKGAEDYKITKGDVYGTSVVFQLQAVNDASVTSITKIGTYTYTLPAGVITSTEGEVFPETTFTFTVAEPFDIVSVSPKETTELSKIEITFSAPVAKVKTPHGLSILDNYYWMPVEGVKIKDDVVFSDDRKTVTLELDNPITTIGTYNFNIYNDIFTSESGMGNSYGTYAISVIDPTPRFELNYSEGERVKQLGDLEITFKNVNEVKLVEGADPIVVYIPGDSEVKGTATLAGNKITVSFGELTEEGIYTYAIPEGFFTMDGKENEYAEVSVELYSFEIVPLEIVSITPVEDNVAQLDKIIIEFNQNIALSYNYETWQPFSNEIVLKGEDKDYILTYNSMSTNVGNTLEYLANAQWDGYKFVSTPITAEGKYTLDLSQIIVDHAGESYIDEYGYPNTRWHSTNQVCPGSKTWTIGYASIDDVVVENGAKVIYDLTGRRIENITNAGIYIVNGKKVLVK